MKKLIKLSANIGLIIALIAVSLFTVGTAVVANENGFSWRNVESLVAQIIGDKVPAPAEESLGAAGGPVNPFNWNSNGGVLEKFFAFPMTLATTSLCTFPVTVGTSTLASIDWIITTGTSTAANIVIATSTLQFATSSSNVLASSRVTVASGAQGSSVWDASDTVGILSPGTFVKVMTESPGLGGYTYVGRCQAVYRQL